MPECKCERCTIDYVVWFTDNDLWNKYHMDYSFLCPSCFSFLAEQQGYITTGWYVGPEKL